MKGKNSLGVGKHKNEEVKEHLLAIIASAEQKLNNSIDLTLDFARIKATKN